MAAFEARCFLCDAPAGCHETNGGASIYIRCSDFFCGTYEISREAMRRLVATSIDKALFSEAAAHARRHERVLRIMVDSERNGAIQLRFVSPAEIRRRRRAIPRADHSHTAVSAVA